MFSDYEKNGYVIIDDLLPEHMYNKINDVCRYAKDYEEVTQIRQGRYEIWKTENDKNFPTADEDYMAHMWDSKSILKHEIFEQVFEDYIKPRMLQLTENKVDRFMHQANNKSWCKNRTLGDTNKYMGFSRKICIDRLFFRTR